MRTTKRGPSDANALELQEASRLRSASGRHDFIVRAANIIIHCEGKVTFPALKIQVILVKIAATLTQYRYSHFLFIRRKRYMAIWG